MQFIRKLAAAVLATVLCSPQLACAQPTVTSFAPTEGLTMGWTQVVFTGTNLGSTSAVRFDGVDATNLIVDGSGTRVTATTPAHARGTVAVELITALGTAAAGSYTYVPQPNITNLGPGEGSMLGGTEVTITGSGFTGATTVLFGSKPATRFTVDSDTQITAVAPPQSAGLTVMFEISTPIAHMPHPMGYFTYTVPPELRPTVTSFAPTEGLTMGWTQVVFTGTNLGSTSAVRFDGVDATNLIVDGSGTRVTATTPAHARGTVAVELITALGTAAAGSYTYVPQPNITNLGPGEGSMLGGTEVTITGSGFTGATTVLFGSKPATRFTVDSDTQITAVAPPQSAGLTVMFEISTPIAHMPHPMGYFTYTVPPELRPTVTSFAPTEGLTMGWTQVVFTGTNLGSTSAVRFDGVDATNLIVDGSGTRVTATTPAHARGTVAVELITALGTAAAGSYTYVPQPNITNLGPGEGSMLGGTEVTITGSGFTGATTVLFGSKPATRFTVDSDTQITAVAPPQSAGLTVMFEISTPIAHMPHPMGYFTYTVPPELRPTVTSFAPTEGLTMGWTQVVFTGTNLGSTSAVRFDGVDATNLIVDGSGTRVTATTPAHARGTVAVELITALGTAAAGSYTYVPQPNITNLGPGEGSMLGGTEVTITGSGFTGATTVLFGSKPATRFTVDSDTQITAVAPPQSAGLTVMFEISTPIAHMPHPMGYFTYTVPPELRPTVTSVAPRWNPPAGGVPVVLTGTNLTGTTAVRFAGQSALSFTVDSATQVTAIPPPAPLQSAGVEVTTGLGTAQGFFLYASAPALASASPTTGPTTGGTPVTLRGSGLLSTTRVSFGGVAASSFNVVDDTRIDVLTPSHAAGNATVQVVAESGTAVLSGAVFAFVSPPADGACGAADGQERITPPTAGLCSAGAAGSVAAASGAFAWTCAGQNGGADSRQCSAPWPLSAVGGLRTSLALPDPATNQGWGLDTAVLDAALPAPLPGGASTQHRALRLVLSGGSAGSSAQFTVHYSEPVPAGAVYLKYGPSPQGLNCNGAACAQPHWYALPGSTAVFAPDRRSVTLTLTDGGLGDSDAVPGHITDPGLPVLLAGAGGGTGPVSVPALGPWALTVLTLALPLWVGLGRKTNQKR